MFARVASRFQGKVTGNLARSFQTQAGAQSRNGFKMVTAAAATAALMAGAYGLQQAQQQDAMCEPSPAPAPAPGSCCHDEPAVKNCAFVFIKPHAVTGATKQLVAEGLKAKGINIVQEGEITAAEIDKGMLIDQHYYAIASKATLLKPNQLNVSAEKFKKQFGVGWQDALNQGVVYNAKDACDFLGLDADGINKAWASCKKQGKLIKFGGGFYCGLIDSVPNKPPVYVFNGFFMSMRNAYVAPGVSIYYYSVEWDAAKLSWDDFRGKVLGPTDPEEAPKDSLRGLIMNDWKALGLGFQPNVGDNGVHASASPFEAMAERNNWLGSSIKDDYFGKAMLNAGVSEATIKAWTVDPQVVYGAEQMPIQASLFDSLEDTDSDECLARCMMINSGSSSGSTDYLTLGAAAAAGGILGYFAK